MIDLAERTRGEVNVSEHFRGYYIYRFLDKNNKIIYIGKTTNMKNRMNLHRVMVNNGDE